MEFKKQSKITNVKDNLNENKNSLPSVITLDNRATLNVTGVLELFSSSETEVKAKTGLGNLKITGQNLKPEKLDLDARILDVSGDIESLIYYGTGSSKSFLKRIFK